MARPVKYFFYLLQFMILIKTNIAQDCDIRSQGYSLNDADQSGIITVGTDTVTFTEQSPGYQLVLISDTSCEKVDSVFIQSEDASSIALYGSLGTRLSNLVRQTPYGYIILGATAINAKEGLDEEAENVLIYLGIDVAEIQNLDTLVFAVRKGFPNEAQYTIVNDRNGPANLRHTFTTDLHSTSCFPPRPNPSLFPDNSGTSDFYIFYSLRSTCSGLVSAWQFKATETGDVSFSVWQNDDVVAGSGDDTIAQLTPTGSNTATVSSLGSQYYCVPKDEQISVAVADVFGMHFPSSGAAGVSLVDSSSYPAAEVAGVNGVGSLSYYDLPVALTSADRYDAVPTSAAANGASETLALLSFRAIINPDFVYTCGCTSTSDCNGADSNMACINSACACRDGFIYSDSYDRCLFNDDLAVGKETFASSGINGNNAVDSGDSSRNTFATTDRQMNPWFAIDLGDTVKVYSVEIVTATPQEGTTIVDSESSITDEDNDGKATVTISYSWSVGGTPVITIDDVTVATTAVITSISTATFDLLVEGPAGFENAVVTYTMTGAQLHDFDILVASTFNPDTYDAPRKQDTSSCSFVKGGIKDESAHTIDCVNVQEGRYLIIQMVGFSEEVIALADVSVQGIPKHSHGLVCTEDSDCNDETLSTLPTRDSNSVCGEEKVCVCKTGYSYDEVALACFEDGEDVCQSNPCGSRGTCVRNENGYTCNCIYGFAGVNCEDIVREALYPFGEDQNDLKVCGPDDAVSPRVFLEQGFMFQCEKYRSFFADANGFATLKNAFSSPVPRDFPLENDQLAMLAPLWADADGCYSGTDEDENVVFFQVYEQLDPEYHIVDDKTAYIISRTKLDLEDYAGETGFNPSLVVIITWYKMIPFPKDTNAATAQRNTFQLVLVGDYAKYRSYMMWNYGNMTWGEANIENSIGYQGPDASYNNPYAGTVNSLNLGTLKGNTDEYGRWLYKVSTDTCEEEKSAEYRCRNWWVKQNEDLIEFYKSILPQCPCQYSTATFDSRYVAEDGTNCVITAFQPQDEEGNSYPAARKCCYDTDGALIVSETNEAGSLFFYNPSFYAEEHQTADLSPKEDCCVLTDLCNLYYEKRPGDNCMGYKAPEIGWCFGEPHIETLDGLSYTFNGKGDYWLIKSDFFNLQARTREAWDGDNQPTPATVFSGFAAKDQSSERAHVEMNAERERLIILVQDGTFDFSDWFYDAAGDPSIYQSGIFLQKIDKSLLLSFGSGIGFFVELSSKQLTITVTGAAVFTNKTTGGLMGVYNGNPNDDLTPPSGEPISVNSTDREIFNFGQTWKVAFEEELFNRAVGTTSSDLDFPDFLPVFEDEIVLTPEEEEIVSALCGDNVQCRFDFSVTKNEDLAASTKQTDSVNTAAKEVLANTVPVLEARKQATTVTTTVIEATVNEEYILLVTAVDPDEDDYTTISMEGGPTGATFDPATGTFTWTPSSLDSVKDLRFTGVDSKGAEAAVLKMTVKLCDCNDNGKCDFTFIQSQYNSTDRFQVVNCECKPFWENTYCQDDFDGCRDQPCSSLQNCTDLPAAQHEQFQRGYNCSDCPSGYSQTESKCADIDECADPSLNDCSQNCINERGSFRCSCNPGYRLNGPSTCEDINECDERLDDCDHVCTNNIGTYTCSCFPGNTLQADGATCNPDPSLADLCAAANCEYICAGDGSGGVECQCPRGYTLSSDARTCTDIDECSTGEVCGPNGICLNLPGSYNCSCSDGYLLGSDLRSCEACPTGSWGAECSKICNCRDKTTVCDPSTGCAACIDGWTGGECREDIDECIVTPDICGDNAECENKLGTYKCNCDEGYYRLADRCLEIDECLSVPIPCLNEGRCVDAFLNYTCDCKDGYTGYKCETDIDECAEDPCLNGATCEDLVARVNCLCTTGYSGSFCQNKDSFTTTAIPDNTTIPDNSTARPEAIDNTGALIGGILGSVLGVMFLTLLVLIGIFASRNRKPRESDSESDSDDASTVYSKSTFVRRARPMHWQAAGPSYHGQGEGNSLPSGPSRVSYIANTANAIDWSILRNFTSKHVEGKQQSSMSTSGSSQTKRNTDWNSFRNYNANQGGGWLSKPFSYYRDPNTRLRPGEFDWVSQDN